MPNLALSKKFIGVDLPRISIEYLFTLDNPKGYGNSEMDTFGETVAVSDHYIAVSAVQEDDANGLNSGKVYVFNTNGALLRTLNNPNPTGTSQSDKFGYSLAITGDYIVVGAIHEDLGITNNGAVYVFSISTGALYWMVENPGIGTGSLYGGGDSFGCSVGASGDYLIIGARGEMTTSSESLSGAAYVYRLSTKTLLHSVTGSTGGNYSGGYGHTVAINDVLGLFAVSSPYYDSPATDAGCVTIYNLQTGQPWNPPIQGSAFANSIGTSLSMSDMAVAIGTDRAENDLQKVRVQHLKSTGWGGKGFTLSNPGTANGGYQESFAKATAVSNRLVVVGAPTEDESDTLTNAGKAYIFDVFSGVLIKTLNNPNPVGTSASDNFGNAVAISKNRICVSAYFERDTYQMSGKVYVWGVKERLYTVRINISLVGSPANYSDLIFLADLSRRANVPGISYVSSVSSSTHSYNVSYTRETSPSLIVAKLNTLSGVSNAEIDQPMGFQ